MGERKHGRCPEMPCDVVFDTAEWHAVYIVSERKAPPQAPPTLDSIVRKIAGIGGFLNRNPMAFLVLRRCG